MRTLVHFGLLSLVTVNLLSFKIWASEFKCEPKKNINENTIYLTELGQQVGDESQKSDLLLKNSERMLEVLKKAICFQRISGDIAIFEYVSAYASETSFQRALQKLSKNDQTLLKDALKKLELPDDL